MAAPVEPSVFSQPSLKELTCPSYGRPKDGQHPPLQQLIRPHIESFNYVLREGLVKAVQSIPPIEFALSTGQRVSLCMTDASIGLPVVPQGNLNANTLKVFPVECRERGTTYKSKVQGTVRCTVDGRSFSLDRVMGEIPIMVKSSVCNLAKLKPAELIRRGEEAEEMGGYFIINGIERIIRMLIMPRRNFPTCTIRPSWKGRGKQYTEYGVMMRCVKADQTGSNMVLHYLSNGTANLSFSFRKEQFFIPVVMVLKALVDTTDQYVYRQLIKGKEDDSFYKGCMANMLRQAQDENLSQQGTVLDYIGQQFRIKLQLPDWFTNTQVANFLLEHCICIHLETSTDKFNVLVHMTQKLFALAKGECAAESADNPMNQELLLGGHLYLMVLKEKIEGWLTSLKYFMVKKSNMKGVDYVANMTTLSEACGKAPSDLTRPMEFLMATGNLVSKTGLGLMQASGLTVVADKLNFMRYLSHFRCVHRGAFFAEMRTTTVRRLLPEAWGFLCPVHTPDGSPCGLMNHMSALCEAVNFKSSTATLPRLLASLGMSPINIPPPGPVKECYIVLLDGCVLGYLHTSVAKDVVDKLRAMKVKGLEKVPPMLEICFVEKTKYASQYSGLFLFTGMARMMRPVKNLKYNTVEMIGTFEQAYLNICITADEFHEGLTTHQELNEYTMLSAIASLTPYSDCNQSPRNMYQCQMGKQTMGTPLHAFKHRSDNKLYRIQTPQAPIVRPYMHDHYAIDNYPLGTNAIVAVISYTGYDMEDAMILNKASYERGFAHGSIYKHEFIDLRELSQERSRIALMFGCKPGEDRADSKLEADGLPAIGTYFTQGDPYYSYINVQTGEVKVVKYKSQEPAYLDHIKVCGNDMGTDELQRICMVLRIQRNPIIGDKFASRHGQKGICSQKWPVENMPFTESGMVPDIIFNPHGFPSRMTIGMMMESMAGKSGAMHGLCHDATPFTFSEDNPAIDYFGRCLTKAGYNYYGTERLYSGVNGREFEADIFIGLVYYQRLRHMVSDKFQVRTTGPIDQLTHQPVKGRKRAGGIRFGEMERDGLLSHGTSFLLQDRLLNCSDKAMGHVCTKCGSILSAQLEKPASVHAAASFEAGPKLMCSVCKTYDSVEIVAVPYVFRYLVAELAAMNIKVTLDIK